MYQFQEAFTSQCMISCAHAHSGHIWGSVCGRGAATRSASPGVIGWARRRWPWRVLGAKAKGKNKKYILLCQINKIFELFLGTGSSTIPFPSFDMCICSDGIPFHFSIQITDCLPPPTKRPFPPPRSCSASVCVSLFWAPFCSVISSSILNKYLCSLHYCSLIVSGVSNSLYFLFLFQDCLFPPYFTHH